MMPRRRALLGLLALFAAAQAYGLDHSTKAEKVLWDSMKSHDVRKLCVKVHVENSDPKTAKLLSSTGSPFFDAVLESALRSQPPRISQVDTFPLRYPESVFEQRIVLENMNSPSAGAALGCTEQESRS